MLLECMCYAELATDHDKAVLFLREGDRKRCEKKLLHNLRMCDYAIQFCETRSIVDFDRLGEARLAFARAQDPLVEFDQWNER